MISAISELIRRSGAWALLALLALCAASSAQAALQARELDGNTGNGIDAYYDTVLDITWLRDANASGPLTFGEARQWADELVVGAYNDWRLPEVKPVDNSGFNYTFADNGSTDFGYNIKSPSSELAHLFSVTLANIGYFDPPSGGPWIFLDLGGGAGVHLDIKGNLMPAFGLQNVGPFSHVQPNHYWSDAPYAPGSDSAWAFDMGSGLQAGRLQSDKALAWAVRTGDVASVPEPQTYAIALTGLAVLALTRKRRV